MIVVLFTAILVCSRSALFVAGHRQFVPNVLVIATLVVEVPFRCHFGTFTEAICNNLGPKPMNWETFSNLPYALSRPLVSVRSIKSLNSRSVRVCLGGPHSVARLRRLKILRVADIVVVFIITC